MISVFDIFKIGIGPSSSHTIGPMWAGLHCCQKLKKLDLLEKTQHIQVDLFGSLALTGKGHGTDKAMILGLSGEKPDEVDPNAADAIFEGVKKTKKLLLAQTKEINFDYENHIAFNRKVSLPKHPNSVTCTALDADGHNIWEETYYSIGGGFVVSERDGNLNAGESANEDFPNKYLNGDELLRMAEEKNVSIADIIFENECSQRSAEKVNKGLDKIWEAMEACIQRGCEMEGTLPGGLNVTRRAKSIHKRLSAQPAPFDPLSTMDWVNMFALAVNEENAAGGRVVTAPTNGAAGVLPAVLAYYRRFFTHSNNEGVRQFLLTSAAIGILYKLNASFSGAEMGCQGEVGVACSMAAGGLAAVMGGTNLQIENAAEIGMEHNLGLTCDPIGGLVQVPCIERNAMGATKAINAARLAVLHGEGLHIVTLDKVIETMRQTGVDMKAKYKETSRGGLAVNVINC